MKVLHIIPSAFEYFNDIRIAAFKIVDKLNDFGVSCEVITLQYDQPSKAKKIEISGDVDSGIKGVAGSYEYSGTKNFNEFLSSFDEYDLIHFHTPFLGRGKDILTALNKTKRPLLVSYYRKVIMVDFLSFFIMLYNRYYLPKLFNQSKMVVFHTWVGMNNLMKKVDNTKVADVSASGKDKTRIMLDLRGDNGIKLKKPAKIDISAGKLFNLYKILINKNSNI